MILTILGVFYATWLHYCVIMALWKAKREGTLTRTLVVLGAIPLGCGYVLDVLSNLIVSLLLWHAPKEALLTMKLIRIQREDPHGWRNAVAKWVCVNMLNPVDPTGHHC